MGFGKVPDNPKVGEAFKSAQGIGIAVGRGEDYGALEACHKAALAGNAEFGVEIGEDVGDGVHKMGLGDSGYGLLGRNSVDGEGV